MNEWLTLTFCSMSVFALYPVFLPKKTELLCWSISLKHNRNIGSPRTVKIVGLPGSMRTHSAIGTHSRAMRIHLITPEGWKWKGHTTDVHTRRAQTFRVVSANCSLIIFHETEFSVLISDESTSWRNQGVKFAGIIKLQCWSWNQERKVKGISMTNMLHLKPLLE